MNKPQNRRRSSYPSHVSWPVEQGSVPSRIGTSTLSLCGQTQRHSFSSVDPGVYRPLQSAPTGTDDRHSFGTETTPLPSFQPLHGPSWAPLGGPSTSDPTRHVFDDRLRPHTLRRGAPDLVAGVVWTPDPEKVRPLLPTPKKKGSSKRRSTSPKRTRGSCSSRVHPRL